MRSLARRRLLVAAALGLVFSLGSARARAQDAEMAQFLLKGARADVEKRKFDAAYTKLVRAEQEAPALLEPIYWLGVVHEGRSERGLAIAAYRRFLARSEAKGASAVAGKDQPALLKKARLRLDAIATGQAELKKLDAAFAAELLGFVRSEGGKDLSRAGEALRHLLDARPGDPEAFKQLKNLGIDLPDRPAGGGAAAPSAAPDAPAGPAPLALERVQSWRSVLNPGDFPSTDGWVYREDGTLELETAVPFMLTPGKNAALRGRYAIEMECRIVDDRSRGSARAAVGIVFASTRPPPVRMLALFATAEDLELHDVESDRDDLVLRKDLPDKSAGIWRQLALIVQGRRVDVYLDGTHQGSYSHPRRDLDGEPGVLGVSCRGEVRSLRVGRLP
jgi:hypothetical protein